MRNLVRLLPAFSLLMILSLVPAHAQVPNLGDLGSLFKKNKSKPITITVNGNQTDNAVQEKGVVYVPLSVLQSLPGVSAALDATGTNVTITTSAPGTAAPSASAATPNSVQVINGVQTIVPPPGTVRGGGLLGQIEGDAQAGDPAARAAPIKAPTKFNFHTIPGVTLDTHSLYIYTDTLGQFVVHGTLKNTSDHTIPYVRISIAFLDADGNRVEVGEEGTSDLGPGEGWKFKVAQLSSLIKSYKILWISDNPLGPSYETPPAKP